MTGDELRAKLFLAKKPLIEIAASVGLSSQGLSQALKVKDVKTGFVEKLASSLNLPLSFFYGDGEDQPVGSNINGSHSPNVSQSIGCDSAMVTEVKLLREQNEFLQSQIKTLLSILEKERQR